MRSRAGMEMELTNLVYQRVLRWFGHGERMVEFCMARNVLMAEADCGDAGYDGLKVAMGSRGMSI